MVVLSMGLQMVSQVANPLAEDCYLDFRRPTILLMAAKLLNNLPLPFRRPWHPPQLLSVARLSHRVAAIDDHRPSTEVLVLRLTVAEELELVKSSQSPLMGFNLVTGGFQCMPTVGT
jgi:hypothetical protein